MILILLGAPGSGKGTQAKLISENRKLPHLSTGDMLRTAMSAGTPLGNKVKDIISRGDLVSDEVIEGIISERIEAPDCKPGFILDGAVRTIPQAEMIDRLLAEHDRALDVVIEMQVDEEALVERLVNRVKEAAARGESVREDDNEETFRYRQKVYRNQTAPLIPHYERQGKLRTVDGMGTVEEVNRAIEAILNGVEEGAKKS